MARHGLILSLHGAKVFTMLFDMSPFMRSTVVYAFLSKLVKAQKVPTNQYDYRIPRTTLEET